MKFPQLLSLSAYNLIRRKRTTAQCISMTSVILLMVFLSAFFISTLVLMLSDSLDNYASKNYLVIRHEMYRGSRDTVMLNQSKQNTLKAKFNSIEAINYYQTFYVTTGSPTFNPLILDGVTYEGNGLNSEFFGWEIIKKEVSAPTFSKGMQAEFSAKFPNQSLIKYGRDIQHSNEVLFPEEFLLAYDLTAEQLLNADSVSYYNMFIDAKIVGVTNQNISLLDKDSTGGRLRDAAITLYAESGVRFEFAFNEDYPEFDLRYNPVTFQRIDLKNAGQVHEIVSFIESELGEEYWVLYANSNRLHKFKTIDKVLIFTRDIVLILLLVIGTALVVFLYSVLAHSVRQKGGYLGMIRAMGLKNNYGIMLCEMGIITAVSAIIALVLSVIAAYIFNGFVISIGWTNRLVLSFDAGLFALVFTLSACLVLLLNVSLALLASHSQSRKTIAEALRL